MSEDQKIRFVLIGGFLGAGKTTLIGELARRYLAAGKRVGIITNDQAANLVDTQNLRSQGFDVGEVAGACFCCSFDDLVATAAALGEGQAPDVLLAEPVGSCADLVATVVLPLQQLLGDRFELAPFGVILKPSHGRRILAGDTSAGRSGFSPQAEYIFRKQLEEADYLMIGRRDQLSEQELASLQANLASMVGSDVPVVAVSPKSGEGVDEVLGYIESPLIAGRRLLDIDYDTYADGEAELGWVNLTAMLKTESPVDLDRFAAELVAGIAAEIVQKLNGQIAHLKTSVLAGDTQAVANVVSNDSGVDSGLIAGRSVAGPLQVIVNARVAVDPDALQEVCRRSVQQVAASFAAEIENVSAHALRPGRPTPTHRVSRG
jgi:Ni2+-binding GTPase involved in maturation of urease and hydrogenase